MADICNIKKEIEYIKKNQEVNSFIIGGDTNTCSSLWDKNYDDKNLNGVNEILDFMVENDMKYINSNNKPTYARKEMAKSQNIKLLI